MSVAWPLVIYYDASCPLCREEMHALKAHDAADRLRLLDASPPGFSDPHLAAAGIGQDALMRLIHARDAAGHWFVGVQVFELAYAAAGLHTVARLWASPRLRPAAPVLAAPEPCVRLAGAARRRPRPAPGPGLRPGPVPPGRAPARPLK
jgi:predicted DCC family thiol-disulfide oxidoreductase YuxK